MLHFRATVLARRTFRLPFTVDEILSGLTGDHWDNTLVRTTMGSDL